MTHVKLEDLQTLTDITIDSAPQRIKEKVQQLIDSAALMAIGNETRQFVITISDDEFQKLSDRSQHLNEVLKTGFCDIRLVIQREGE